MTDIILFKQEEIKDANGVSINQNELIKVAMDKGVDPEMAQSLNQKFGGFYDLLTEMRSSADDVFKLDASDPETGKEARRVRLLIRSNRTGTEKVKDAVKAEYLLKGNATQAIFNLVRDTSKPLEDRLLQIENHAENLERERLEKIKLEREEKLQAIGVDTSAFRLDEMQPEAFEQLYNASEIAFEQNKKQYAENKRLREEEEKRKADEKVQLEAENKAVIQRLPQLKDVKWDGETVSWNDKEILSRDKMSNMSDDEFNEFIASHNADVVTFNKMVDTRLKEVGVFAGHGPNCTRDSLSVLSGEDFSLLLNEKKTAFEDFQKWNALNKSRQESSRYLLAYGPTCEFEKLADLSEDDYNAIIALKKAAYDKSKEEEQEQLEAQKTREKALNKAKLDLQRLQKRTRSLIKSEEGLSSGVANMDGDISYKENVIATKQQLIGMTEKEFQVLKENHFKLFAEDIEEEKNRKAALELLRQEATDRKKQEDEEAERLAKIEEAGDKEKLIEFARLLTGVAGKSPDLKSTKAKAVLKTAIEELTKLHGTILEEAKKM